MRAFSIGIDCGSTFCKGALYSANGVEALAYIPTGWNIAAAGQEIIDRLKLTCPQIDDIPMVATGYGREKVQGAHKTVTEITCHARGAEILAPGVRCVIDIGGQDYKVIEVQDGRMLSFQMNDKCAAGSGRFLEMVLNRLDVDLKELDAFLAPEKSIKLNSTCVVFAESEIVGLLSQSVSREEILGGVISSMAVKIAGQAARLGALSPAALTGGLSTSKGICKILSKRLDQPVKPTNNGLYAGAIGAAFLAFEMHCNQ